MSTDFDLATVRQHVLEHVLLDLGLQGEEITFVPKQGAGRTVRAHCTVEVDYEDDGQGNEKRVERLRALVGRDEQNATIGGVATVRIGDAIVRGSAVDPDTRPFMFSGEKENVRPHAWRLVCVRDVIGSIGARQ